MALMILITGAAVKLVGRIIARVYFEVEGLDSQLARTFFDKLDGAPANPLPPVLRLDVQFIEEGILPVVFEAETHGENDVARGSSFIREKPRHAKSRVGEKSPEHVAHGRLVKEISARLLFGEGAHHAEQILFIGRTGGAKNDGSHAIHHSARGVWRRARSSPSGDLRPGRYRCPRENIRETGQGLSNGHRSEEGRFRRQPGGARPCREQRCERGGGRFPRRLPKDPPPWRSAPGTRL